MEKYPEGQKGSQIKQNMQPRLVRMVARNKGLHQMTKKELCGMEK